MDDTVTKTFGFSFDSNGDLVATNGPIVVHLDVIGPFTMRVNLDKSNVTRDWKFLPGVVLAASRWRRHNERETA